MQPGLIHLTCRLFGVATGAAQRLVADGLAGKWPLIQPRIRTTQEKELEQEQEQGQGQEEEEEEEEEEQEQEQQLKEHAEHEQQGQQGQQGQQHQQHQQHQPITSGLPRQHDWDDFHGATVMRNPWRSGENARALPTAFPCASARVHVRTLCPTPARV